VEVLSGLEVGDLVVTLGQFRLQDGAAVRVVADGQPSAVERTSSPVTVTPAAAERR
jgi:hypothetical protein